MPRPIPTRSTAKQRMVGEFRRNEILSAARRVFARKGFALGIMDEIAREAGIAKGTIYLYFSSKTDVYKALLEHDMRVLQQATLDRVGRVKNLRDKIQAFVLARLENADDKRQFFRIMDSEHSNLTMTRRQYRDYLHEPVQLLSDAIQEAVRSGEIRAIDPERAAWLIADAVRGAIQRRLLSQSPSPTDDDVKFLLDFLWSSLTAKKKN